LEELETRTLLSASALASFGATPDILAARESVNNPIVRPFTPSAIRSGYGVNLLQFSTGGGHVRGDGTGQTIAIVDAFNDPNIVPDLAKFDATFRQANPPSFTVLNENGGTDLSGIPNAPHSSWAIEESLDVEWAHTIAPGANIVLFEGNSSSFTDLGTAVTSAANPATYSALGLPAAGVISNSYGAPESRLNLAAEQFFDSTYYQPISAGNQISVVFSSGDSGVQQYPSASPYVLSVGGTQVSFKLNGFSVAYNGEVAWSPDPGSTGGGTSLFEPIPSYQVGYPNITGTNRQMPDVSWDADPASGVYITDTYDFPQFSAIGSVGGTSLAAPLWAGLLAVTNQGRALAGSGTLGNAQEAVYGIPAADFHDITSGHNNVATAGPGYDEVTGIGSPIPGKVVADLVNATTGPVVAAVIAPAGGLGASSGASVAKGHAMTNIVSTIQPSTNGATTSIALSSPTFLGQAARIMSGSSVTVTVPAISLGAHSDPSSATVLPGRTTSAVDGFHGATESGSASTDLAGDSTGEETEGAAEVAPMAGVFGGALPGTVASKVSDAVFTDYNSEMASGSTTDAPVATLANDEAQPVDLAMMAGLALALGGSWSGFARSEENRKIPVLRS
jgi:subtilase family serine protease